LKKTLLIDGANLMKIGFHGVKDLYSDGSHLGAIYHFINTIRKFLEEHNHDKVVVFWDAENSSSTRKGLYPQYKANRKNDMNEYKLESYLTQNARIKEYLEEVFIRQVEMVNNEGDDLISYYCKMATNENIIIFSSDKDFTQLISDRVSIYSPNSKQYFKQGDLITINKVQIPHYNVLTCKILTGDNSDNISGIEGLGEKTLVKLFPDMLVKPCTIDEIRVNAGILTQEKKSKVLENILTGKSKNGILGEEFYTTNEKIINLSSPLITDDAKELVELYYRETLDPDGRGYKGLIKMMMEDGFFKYLPKGDDAWVNFVRPFMKLTRKEKRNYKNN